MKTAVHRHRLGKQLHRCRDRSERFQAVPPGKKSAGVSIKCLEQQCDDELREDPGFGSDRVLVREMTESEQLFETFEYQLDLPAESVELEHVRRRNQLFGKGREDHDKVCRLERPRVGTFAFLLRCRDRLALSLRCKWCRELDCNYSPMERLSVGVCQANLPCANFADLEPLRMLKGLEGPTPFIDHRRMSPTQAHQDMSAGIDCSSNAGRPKVVPVGDQHVPFLHRCPFEQLRAVSVCQLKPITGEGHQVQRVVNPPLGTLAGWALDRRAVYGPGL